MAITPFQISIPDAELQDLRARLARTRWPDAVDGAKWDYGTNLTYLQELCRYWEREFDWRRHEQALNGWRQFRTVAGGLGIHFIHERAAQGRGVPLLLTHGYPDSFARFHKVLPKLIAAGFDVVVPSLPGFGFSDRPRERGMTPDVIAGLFLQVMTELGYDRFAAHGGDWGGAVTDALARQAPGRVLGTHQTDVPYQLIFTVKPEELTAAEQKFVAAGRQWQMTEGGYAMIQGSKPQTLAYAMNDSPAGLAGWIVEKFRAWSDCGGDVERRFDKDELLTHISLYWLTQTAGSAFRLYYEAAHTKPAAAGGEKKVPKAIALFPREMVSLPRAFAERFYDIRRWTEMPRGGHFAALEEPDLLAEDLRAFFLGDLGLGR